VLPAFNTLFVGVRCPLEVAKQREQERGDRTLGLVEAHYDIVHSHGIYDLEIDTSVLTPTECASRIKDRLQNGPPPTAIQKLRDILLV
jgi:chloramphenicol 3-O phosphotransferase